MTVLSQITSPADLKKLPAVTLDTLAQEIRRFLIAKVSEAGGHLGSNLGVVELTIAVHRVFNSPCDVLLFDTGHQAYVHKILTGRCAEFSSLRQAGGLSGYSSRTESVHDVIENSHASTALSYADGLAKAFTLHGSTDRRVVAIVGDGALTGGMCWEALNNLGAGPERPVIIVLNDNGRSYSPTVGGVARHLAALPGAGQTLFENLGLTYLGPVDGHDIAEMESALRRAGELNHPVVVHCVTRKGMGYPPAEHDDTDHLHTVGVIDPSTGRPRYPGKPTWTSVFAEEITAIGAQRADVVCVTAAMLRRRAAPVAGHGGAGPSRDHRPGRAQPPRHVGLVDPAGRARVTYRRAPGLREATRTAPRSDRDQRRPYRDPLPESHAGPGHPAMSRIGQCDVLRNDPAAIGLLVAVGALAGPCLTAADELAAHNVPVTVVNPRWIAPVDPALLTLAAAHRLVLTVEDTSTTGALGARIAQALAAAGSDTCAATFALPPRFLPHATRDQTLQAHGLDGVGIATAVLKRLASTHRNKVQDNIAAKEIS